MISLTLIILKVHKVFDIYRSFLQPPSPFLDYNWSVCEDQHNSDHFPIIIEQNTFSTEDHSPKWKLNRANWDLFNTLCTGKLIPENFKESSDPIAEYNELINTT